MDLLITIAVFIAAIIMFSITKWGAPRTAKSIKDAMKIAKIYGEIQHSDEEGFGLKTELGQWVILKTSNNWKVIFPDFWEAPLETAELFQKMAMVNSKFPFAKITLESSGNIIISCADLHVFNEKTLKFSLGVIYEQVTLWKMINSNVPEDIVRNLPPEIRDLVNEFSGEEEATMGFQ